MPRAEHAQRVKQPDSAPKHDLRIDSTVEAVARTVLFGGAPAKPQKPSHVSQPQ